MIDWRFNDVEFLETLLAAFWVIVKLCNANFCEKLFIKAQNEFC